MARPTPMQPAATAEAVSASPAFATPPSPARGSARPELARDFEDSGRPGKKARVNPPRFTAAAAMAEQAAMQTSPNPAVETLNALLGTMHKAQSPGATTPTAAAHQKAATTLSEPLTVVAQNLQAQPDNTAHGDGPAQTSPVSVSSLGTIESVAAPSALATTVHSPSPMEDAPRQTPRPEGTASTSPENENKTYPYPAPLLQPHLLDQRRGMSLPGSGLRQGSPRSPAKKHRCPYCATEFTRHHNLKSHLLTHSQEKPYVCSTCQSRFRRLHDLKRHTKLHTGERPHICPKCGRKFARGDALARHNKGPGGCAGRRASMGSFDGDGDFDGGDDSMDGVVYNEPDTMDDEEGNDTRPGIKRHRPSGDDADLGHEQYSRIPNTYPPIQGRPPGGIASGAFPPRANFSASASGSSAASGNPSTQLPYPHPSGSGSNLHPPPGAPAPSVFSQNPMTESPKPLASGQTHPRPSSSIDSTLHNARSPTISSQLGQQQFGRAPGARSASGASVHLPSGPQLPPPHGLNPPDARYTLPSQGGPAHPPTQPIGPPTHMSGSGPLSSHSNSLSSHQGSGENQGPGASFLSKDDRLWAYVKSLEARIDQMQGEINGLRAQLATAAGKNPAR